MTCFTHDGSMGRLYVYYYICHYLLYKATIHGLVNIPARPMNAIYGLENTSHNPMKVGVVIVSCF